MASIVDVRMARERADSSTGEVTEARSEAFRRWINFTLRCNSIAISNLKNDLESGIVLINLLQCLSPGKNMPGRYAAM